MSSDGSVDSWHAAEIDGRSLASDLLEHGRCCRAMGLAEQGRAILTQAWTIAQSASSPLSDMIAWELGWTCSCLGDHYAASIWFDRVEQPVEPGRDIWPQLRAILATHHAQRARPDASPGKAGRHHHQDAIRTARGQIGNAPLLEVNDLGRFRIVRDGVVLPGCRSRKATALFRYLLTRDRWAATREELVEQFWPNARLKEGMHSLHTAVSMLRTHLDLMADSYIVCEAGQYLISPDIPVRVDSLAFRDGLRQAEQFARERNTAGAERAYERVLALYLGDYHVDDPDVVWAIIEREHLVTGYLTALDRLGRLYMQRGAFELAVDTFQRLIERDLYREDVYARIMQCYLHLGRRSDALKHYDLCATLLQRDLGLDPGVELRALRDDVALGPPEHYIEHADSPG